MEEITQKFENSGKKKPSSKQGLQRQSLSKQDKKPKKRDISVISKGIAISEHSSPTRIEITEDDILTQTIDYTKEAIMRQFKELKTVTFEDPTIPQPILAKAQSIQEDPKNTSWVDHISDPNPTANTSHHSKTQPEYVIKTKSPKPHFLERQEGAIEDLTINYQELANKNINIDHFITKESLSPTDVCDLYFLFKKEPSNPKLWNFVNKLVKKPIDFELFFRNFDLLSPQFIQSLIVIGSYSETKIDTVSGEEKTVHIVRMNEFKRGGMGIIYNVYYCDETNLALNPVLLKTSLDDTTSKVYFSEELYLAKKIRSALERNDTHPGAKHILSPIYISDHYYIMPIIRDSDGGINNFSKIDFTKENLTDYFAKQLIGAVNGLQFLGEIGLIDNDLKNGNLLLGDQGAIVGDIGGFLEYSKYQTGEIEIRGIPEDASMYPMIENQIIKTKSDKKWELLRGNVQKTPYYNSAHLLAMELSGQISRHTFHKYALARIVEIYFIKKMKVKNPINYESLSEMDKLYQDPIQLNTHQLEPKDQLLYSLYIKLHQAHFHPYRFKEDNPKNGIDPEFISMQEIKMYLQEILTI